MNRAIRDAKRLLSAMAESGGYGAEEAAAVLRQPPFTKRKASVKKPFRTIAQDRKAKREKHAAETARIREAVMNRAAGVCELCRQSERAGDPLQIHHMLPGTGRRRQQQSVDTCVAAHMTCHREWHSGRREWP